MEEGAVSCCQAAPAACGADGCVNAATGRWWEPCAAALQPCRRHRLRPCCSPRHGAAAPLAETLPRCKAIAQAAARGAAGHSSGARAGAPRGKAQAQRRHSAMHHGVLHQCRGPVPPAAHLRACIAPSGASTTQQPLAASPMLSAAIVGRPAVRRARWGTLSPATRALHEGGARRLAGLALRVALPHHLRPLRKLQWTCHPLVAPLATRGALLAPLASPGPAGRLWQRRRQ